MGLTRGRQETVGRRSGPDDCPRAEIERRRAPQPCPCGPRSRGLSRLLRRLPRRPRAAAAASHTLRRLASERHAHCGAPADAPRSLVDRAGRRAAGAPGGSTPDRLAPGVHRPCVLHQLLRSADRRGWLPPAQRRRPAARYLQPAVGLLRGRRACGSADLIVRRRCAGQRVPGRALLAGVAVPAVQQHPGRVDGCPGDHRRGGRRTAMAASGSRRGG